MGKSEGRRWEKVNGGGSMNSPQASSVQVNCGLKRSIAGVKNCLYIICNESTMDD
jgi:hypothetical protein